MAGRRPRSTPRTCGDPRADVPRRLRRLLPRDLPGPASRPGRLRGPCRGDIGTLDRVLDDLETETGGAPGRGHRLARARGPHRRLPARRGPRSAASPSARSGCRGARTGPIRSLAGCGRVSQRCRTALELQFAARAAEPRRHRHPVEHGGQAERAGAGQPARPASAPAPRSSTSRPGRCARTPGGITGLTVDVLGPTRDEAFLRRMDPPKAERYLRRRPAARWSHGALYPFADPQAAGGGRSTPDGGPARRARARGRAVAGIARLRPRSGDQQPQHRRRLPLPRRRPCCSPATRSTAAGSHGWTSPTRATSSATSPSTRSPTTAARTRRRSRRSRR